MGLKSRPLRASAATLSLAVVLVLAACGDKTESAEQPDAGPAPNIVQAGAPGEGSTTLSAEEFSEIEIPTFVDADVRFMQGMIHHHAQALRMTDLVPTHAAKGSPLLLMAERMDLTQTSEIEQMQRWLSDRGQKVPVLHKVHHHAHGPLAGMAMPGMLTEEQLRRLERTRGKDFDKLFLTGMIHHHQGALTMVRELYSAGGGQEPDADAFARHVEADQRIEIERMQQLLAAQG